MQVNTINAISSFGKKEKTTQEKQPAPDYTNISFKNLYDDFKISSYPYIPGKQIVECLGPVYGNALWSRNIGKDIGATIKSIVGGKINAYSELAKMTQRDAISDMIKNAKEIGANGIIGYMNIERGWESDSFMRAQGIAVKIKDGSEQKDIDQMKKHGVKIST